jgi:NitT/TauT family transport system ATP-binding protein
MDEPFASLDEQNRIILQQQLLKIWEESHKTTVFITHSIDEAILLGDRVLVMTAQPGRLKADIKISLNRPRELSGIRSNPAFISLYEKIWQLLREEVLKAKN